MGQERLGKEGTGSDSLGQVGKMGGISEQVETGWNKIGQEGTRLNRKEQD